LQPIIVAVGEPKFVLVLALVNRFNRRYIASIEQFIDIDLHISGNIGQGVITKPPVNLAPTTSML